MSDKQIRLGQLIAPFGPGSIYTDRTGTPQVVAGLDFWFMRWDEAKARMVESDDREEFLICEPRLSEILKVDTFCLPPDYRREAPINAGLNIPALRFPRWYRATKSGTLKLVDDVARRVERPPEGGRYQPVRFISVCSDGHLNEFPWKEWIECQCADESGLVLTDRGGSELSSVKVHCKNCPSGSTGAKGKNLSGVTMKPKAGEEEQSKLEQSGISCPGGRPWLGKDAAECGCTKPLIGALINQTNIYFARTMSALALPDVEISDPSVASLAESLKAVPILGNLKTLWKLKKKRAITLAIGELEDAGITFDENDVEPALDSLFNPDVGLNLSGALQPAEPEDELLAFRRAEANVIRHGVTAPPQSRELFVKSAPVPNNLKSYLSSVGLVERLRETRAFYGFDRLEPNPSFLSENPMPGAVVDQLFLNPPPQEERWLPAVITHGEGIFFELSETAIQAWLARCRQQIEERITDSYVNSISAVRGAYPPHTGATREWAARFLLIHTTAHCLIHQLVFECGYSSASLRERLYVSADPAAPMSGALIYTAAGDAEGTLGGLVRLGHPDRFGPIFERALMKAHWCSADPVCSEDIGGRGARLANKAACHSCVLLPETSCETINDGLDRALVVGLPDNRDIAFFDSSIISADAAAEESLDMGEE